MRLSLSISRFGGGIGIPDTTPAEITNLTAGPQATGTGDVPASFDLSENATVFWVLVTNGSTAPSVAEVVAGQASGGGSPADGNSFSAVADSGVTQDIALASGLSGAYDLYMVALDGPQNLPAAVDSVLNITINTTAPTVTPTPADGATDVAIDADLIFTFSKSMKTTGTSATVTLKNVGGATIETFDPDVDGTWSTTTNANDTWTVTPASNFTEEASLAVQYSGFEDTFGNAVLAVSDDTTWNFDVVAAGFTDPTDLGSKLIQWIDFGDASTRWQDTARTTPATSVSDPVRYFDDKSGNGNDISATSGFSAGNMIVLANGVDVNDAGFMIHSTATGFTSNMEVYALIERDGDTKWVHLGKNNDNSYSSGVSESGGALAVDNGTTGTIVHTVDNVDQSSPTSATLYTAIDSAGPGYVVQGQRGQDLTGLTTGLLILAYNVDNYRFSGNARHFVITTGLTTGERADLHTWFDGEK